MSWTHSSSKLNTVTPCAACKLLRRRCAPDCAFSPYFSPYEPQRFTCVHKVFGASNVSKMLKEVAENERADVANSLVYEAYARLRDPVYGCIGTISSLQEQAQKLRNELDTVQAELMRCKYSQQLAIASAAHQQQEEQQQQPPPAGGSHNNLGFLFSSYHTNNNSNRNNNNNNSSDQLSNSPSFSSQATTVSTDCTESPTNTMASIVVDKERYWSLFNQAKYSC